MLRYHVDDVIKKLMHKTRELVVKKYDGPQGTFIKVHGLNITSDAGKCRIGQQFTIILLVCWEILSPATECVYHYLAVVHEIHDIDVRDTYCEMLPGY